MLIPVCRATDTMPRRTTLLHSDTKPHRLAQHKASLRDASRARVQDVTRAEGHERVIHNVSSSGWLHRWRTAPLSANHTKHTRHIKQRDLGRVMPWVVCLSSCRCGVLARIPQTDVSAWFVFSQRIRLNGSDVPHACILFGVFGVDLQCHVSMASVSRMGLRGSLFVVRHSLCQLVSLFQRGVGFFSGHVSSNAL